MSAYPTSQSRPAHPDPTLSRIADLQAELNECRAEIGVLKLQLDILSTTDPISGLPNIHGMIQVAEDAAARLRRTGEPFGMMMVRVPALEQINAAQEGAVYRDAVRHTAAMVVAALRQVDRVGRLDAATFLAVLPSLTSPGAAAVTHRVATLLRSVPLAFDDREVVRLQPAIGVVIAASGGAADVPALLDALYDARERASFDAPVIVVAPPPTSRTRSPSAASS